ncbi:MAG TPA: alpha/beta fold hydrolase [Chitinophaga sp.]|uniref:thioesterase II family protein n=1 Tax=Chitinophaga sp. TaxID=1869181 RepID=UPI002B5519AB|nr:alpha/beta fold hydrolase [Chitinophaga sp.]HVI48348.1 alpha/beta fold hydrolase [Chitinophaga sp.]
MDKLILYCLPFAGGSRYSYRVYEESMPPFINVIPLEYPGRGARTKDPLVGDINALVEDLYAQIKGSVDNVRYAIYGHSMGGLMACLLARKLIACQHRTPLHLFVTGTSGPSAPSRGEKKRHLLNKPDFIQEVKDLNGSPEEILSNDELLDYIEPILRNDFRVTENYIYTPGEKLNIPMTVITGTREDMTAEDIQLWQRETSVKVDFRRMPGHHFFIYKYPFEIVQIIAKKLVIHSKSFQS